MQIYINKNNQQQGPFEEAKIIEMLNSGQLLPDDLGIRYGGKEWQKLGNLFPNIGKQEVVKTSPEPVQKKSRKGLLLGCAGFFLIAILVAGVLGFLAYRNLNPADSTENLPDKVKDFKLMTRYSPKGNIWGTETSFVGLYENTITKKTVLYLMIAYSSEEAAKAAFSTDLAKSCKSGETPMYFTFNKSGTEMSQGATCAIPLYVQKDNKLATLGGSGADVDDFIEFAENLPFNQGATMTRKDKR